MGFKPRFPSRGELLNKWDDFVDWLPHEKWGKAQTAWEKLPRGAIFTCLLAIFCVGLAYFNLFEEHNEKAEGIVFISKRTDGGLTCRINAGFEVNGKKYLAWSGANSEAHCEYESGSTVPVHYNSRDPQKSVANPQTDLVYNRMLYVASGFLSLFAVYMFLLWRQDRLWGETDEGNTIVEDPPAPL